MDDSKELFAVRSIVPNTSSAYILRVYEDGLTEFVTIVAWRMEWTKHRHRCANPKHYRDTEHTDVWPLTIEDDYGISGVYDFIVDHGRYVDTMNAFFCTIKEAVDHAVARLTKPV